MSFLVGITCDPPEIFEIFNELRLNVVATPCYGTRYLQGSVSLSDDNRIAALADRHSKRFLFPFTITFIKTSKRLTSSIKKQRQRPYYNHIEFCESQEFDCGPQKNDQRRRDTKYTSSTRNIRQLLSCKNTRLQAFIESLERGTL